MIYGVITFVVLLAFSLVFSFVYNRNAKACGYDCNTCKNKFCDGKTCLRKRGG